MAEAQAAGERQLAAAQATIAARDQTVAQLQAAVEERDESISQLSQTVEALEAGKAELARQVGIAWGVGIVRQVGRCNVTMTLGQRCLQRLGAPAKCGVVLVLSPKLHLHACLYTCSKHTALSRCLPVTPRCSPLFPPGGGPAGRASGGAQPAAPAGGSGSSAAARMAGGDGRGAADGGGAADAGGLCGALLACSGMAQAGCCIGHICQAGSKSIEVCGCWPCLSVHSGGGLRTVAHGAGQVVL